ncbi:hypothetical protein BURPSPAST_AA0265 [Burkholderia pseudomallei Pasteur 52237]|nr:hypothetical protein BURPSPAST_AA0265 [Burkholderia pseudomallei Pasteur 52237]
MERIEHLPYFDHQTGRFRYIRIALEGDGLSLGMLQKFLHCFYFYGVLDGGAHITHVFY